MADKKMETTIIQAKAHWCKLIGKPRDTYDGKNKEWTVDLELDKNSLLALKEFGIDRFYVKAGKPNKDGTKNELTGKPILRLDRKATRGDGSAANPVPLVGPNGQPWDQAKLIGNGSVVNVKITKFEVKLPGQPLRQKPYLLELQVWDHVEYEGNGSSGGFPTKNVAAADDWGIEEPASTGGPTRAVADFDDEIPFN